MNSVKIIYNPYIQEMKVYINDVQISRYSSIIKYTYTPFNKWCNVILDEIYNEVNDEFHLIFKSGIFENQIMEVIADKYSQCIGFTSEDLDINIPTYKRIVQLENLVGGQICKKDMYLNISSKEEYIVESMKEILQDSGVFYYDEKLNALVNEEYPMCKLIIKEDNEICKTNETNTFKIHICNEEIEENILCELKEGKSTIFIAKLGSNNNFLLNKDNIYVYNVRGQDIVQFSTFIIEEYILNRLLNEVYTKVNIDIKDGKINLNKNDIKIINSLVSINPLYESMCEKNIYLGRSTNIEVIAYPYDINDNKYYFEYETEGIVCINDNHIESLKSGSTKVYVYKNGNKDVLDSFEINVMEKKLVSEINVPQKSKCMPCEAYEKLEWTYIPLDAENIDEIRWKSSDNTIAVVDNRGGIKSLKEGKCTITAYTQETESSMYLNVQPNINDIIIPQSYIEIVVGENIEFKYSLNPKECFEKEYIKIWCSDESVILYKGGYITALKPGESKLIIYTADERITRECRVKVNKPSLFRRKR